MCVPRAELGALAGFVLHGLTFTLGSTLAASAAMSFFVYFSAGHITPLYLGKSGWKWERTVAKKSELCCVIATSMWRCRVPIVWSHSIFDAQRRLHLAPERSNGRILRLLQPAIPLTAKKREDWFHFREVDGEKGVFSAVKWCFLMFNVLKTGETDHIALHVFAKVVGELMFWSGEQHAIIAQHDLFQSISMYQLDRTEHCRDGFQSASIHINPHQSTPIYINLHQSPSSHLICFQFGFSCAGSRTDRRRSKQSFFEFPMSARSGFQLTCQFLGRKPGISSLWRFCAVHVWAWFPGLGFLGGWPPLL